MTARKENRSIPVGLKREKKKGDFSRKNRVSREN